MPDLKRIERMSKTGLSKRRFRIHKQKHNHFDLIQKLLFSSDPEGRLNTFPSTKSEKRYANIVVETLKRYIRKKDTVLEISSGNGWTSIPLIKEGYDIIMSEISNWRLEQLKKNVEKERLEMRILNIDAENINLNRQFDYIICIDSMHHFSNLNMVAYNFYNALKIGGKAICIDKNYLNPLTWIGDMVFNFVYSGWKEKTLTKYQIIRAFEVNGFGLHKIGNVKKSWFPLSNPFVYVFKKKKVVDSYENKRLNNLTLNKHR